jgi:hypothetical protein
MVRKDRQSLLQYKEKSHTVRVPLVTTYHPVLKDLGSILRLRKLQPILHTNARMVDVFRTLLWHPSGVSEI